MRKIFISYGNERYYSSLERLKKEAETLEIFDEIRIFTDKNLPERILQHTLFQYDRGGGYWIWKPWVILNTLETLQNDDILIYSDAGCQLFQDSEWGKWWKLMEKYNGIFFCYGGTMEQFCKSDLLKYFGNNLLKYYYQIQSGFLIIKKPAQHVIEEWMNIMFNMPEMVMDTTSEECERESKRYRGHRHDQAILSGLVYRNERESKLEILWQRMESRLRNGQAVYAARICTGRNRPTSRFEPLYITIVKFFLIYPYRKVRMKILKFISKW